MFQNYADKASANANNIRTEANKTKIEALRLGNEAEKLHQRMDITDSMMRQYEIQVAKDANVTTEVIDSFMSIKYIKSRINIINRIRKKILNNLMKIKKIRMCFYATAIFFNLRFSFTYL